MKKQKLVPEIILSLKAGYGKEMFLKDLIAGVIVGIIALPLSIALAIASGASPSAGLITAVFAGAMAAVMGGSKMQISGPTGAFIVIVYGIISKYGIEGLMLATFMAGIFIIILGLCRLGKFVKYIPLPVITGFTAGIAATIFVGQLNDFFGLGLKGLPAETPQKLFAIVTNLGSISWLSVILGAFAVALIVVVPRIQKILPGPLVAIIICTVINLLIPVKCVTMGDIYGEVSVKIVPSLGFFDFSKIGGLIVPALTIAFLAAIESLLSAVVADGMTGAKHNPNMELIGQGTANIASALFGGLPATGAIARTSANIRSGGHTPVSSLVHSLTVLLLSLFLMPYASYIPMTVFAAVLIVVCYNMLNIKEIKKVLKTTPVDIGLMALTFILTVVFDLVVAILVCTFLSLGYQLFKLLVKKKKAVREETPDGIKIKGSVSYFNYEKVMACDDGKETVIDMSEVEDIDATVIDYLETKIRRKQIKITAVNGKIKKHFERHEELTDGIAE